MLLKNLKYAEYSDKTETHICLTELGRKVKKVGGHFAHTQNVADKEERKEIIERLE